MIVYLFNHYFPDNSGFGRRCEREILALSEVDDVTVICRKNEHDLEHEKFQESSKTSILRYSANSEVVHRPENYKSNGFYEIKRNLEINLAQIKLLRKVFSENKNKTVNLYVVNSPLTVPFVAFFVAKFSGVQTKAVAFHDLEPELAMHMKKLDESNWLVKLTFWLEKFVCHNYQKIIVTSQGQADELIKRTGISQEKIMAIPNSTDIFSNKAEAQKGKVDSIKFKDSDFLVMYMSTLSFGYTVEGLMSFLSSIKKSHRKIDHLKFVIIGAGDALPLLEEFIQKKNSGMCAHTRDYAQFLLI